MGSFIDLRIDSLIYFCETMKHQAAYSLLFLSGKSAPTQKEVEAFMKTAGVAVDKDSIKAFFKVMDGKDVPTLVRDGEKKKISMPCGGGGGGAAGPAAAGPVAAAKVEEKKEEAEEVDMGGLFGDDDD